MYNTKIIAPGHHNCLWCHFTSSNLKLPLQERGCCTPRTLETLQDAYSHFIYAGGGHMKVAKMCNNIMENLSCQRRYSDSANYKSSSLHPSPGKDQSRLKTPSDRCSPGMHYLFFLATYSHYVTVLRSRSGLRTELENQRNYITFFHFLVYTGLSIYFVCTYLDQTLVTCPIYDEASSHHSRVRTLKVCVMKTTQHQNHSHSKAFCFKIHSTQVVKLFI